MCTFAKVSQTVAFCNFFEMRPYAIGGIAWQKFKQKKKPYEEKRDNGLSFSNAGVWP